MICPRFSEVFYKKVAKKVESAKQENKKENKRENRPQFYFDKRGSLRRRNNFLSNIRVRLVLTCQLPMLPKGDGRNLLEKDNSLGIRSGGILKWLEVHR